MNWHLFFAAVSWWGITEFIRGRLMCPSDINLALTILGPAGAIILALLSFIY